MEYTKKWLLKLYELGFYNSLEDQEKYVSKFKNLPKKLALKAYEGGFYGLLEFKEDFIDELIEENIKQLRIDEITKQLREEQILKTIYEIMFEQEDVIIKKLKKLKITKKEFNNIYPKYEEYYKKISEKNTSIVLLNPTSLYDLLISCIK